MPTKYLAITIAGAVSLGSYEAGVMYEVLDAIRQHNDDPRTAQEKEYIRIDVLTGASAGGMTAAILAQRLLCGKGTFRGPYENPLYDVWVKRIDLAQLLNTTDKPIADGGDPATLSVLSSSLINSIARESLVRDDGTGHIPVDGGSHNAIDQNRGIRLGLALTNINGINYGYPLVGGGRFQYTQFCDQALSEMHSGDLSLDLWRKIAEAAVACGAFPLAFRAKNLVREREEYGRTPPPEPWPASGDPCTFTYTDGGVLQNQPLGMAKKLVDANDEHLDTQSRFYLFVSPHAMDGEANQKLREANTDLFRMAKRLVKIYVGQATFRDWIQAEQVNAQIDMLDSRAKALKDGLLNGSVEASALETVSVQILGLLYGDGEGDAERNKAEQRLGRQYKEEVSALGGALDGRAHAFVHAVLVLEKAANLGARDRMRIYGVLPGTDTLAGAGLSAFVGFFDQKFRDHDYDLGRTAARELLQGKAIRRPGELGPVRYAPSAIRPVDTDLNGLALCDVPKDDVDVLKKGLKKRVNALIGDALNNPLARYPARLGAALLLELFLDWEFSRRVQE